MAFHINPKTGKTGQCRARKGLCPFGAVEEHFGTREEAQIHYEQKMESFATELERTEFLLEANEDRLEDLEVQYKELTKKLKVGEATKEELALVRKEIKEATDDLRQSVYERKILEREAAKFGMFDEERANKTYMTRATKRSNNHYRKTLKNNQFFDKRLSKEMYRLMISEFSAMSGLDREESKKLLRSYDKDSGLSRDEYVVKLFQDHANNSDKDMVFVDLETTNFHPTSGEIIEIGIVKVNSKGEILETVNERFDIDETAREKLGTGAVDIHKINPEDIKGKPKFTDPAVQERLGKILNDRNVVFSAHNAGFENPFLNHYLEGFYEARDQYSYETISSGNDTAPILDTRNTSMFFGHSLPNSKLESFSQGNGVPYENAHSGFDDAMMSMKAYFNFKKALVNSEPGQRPYLSWDGMPVKEKK